MRNIFLLILFSVFSNSIFAGIGSGVSSPGALPVELTSFIGSTTGQGVVLNWVTASEINNYGFEIERSVVSLPTVVGGQLSDEFEKIGFIEGHGNSNSPKEYSFTDSENSVAERSRSYRLKQIDFDGKFEYSEIITVETLLATSLPTEFALEQNYPNPFNPTTSIKYSVPSSEYVSLKVYDVLGNEVKTLVNESKEAGSYEVSFDASNYPSGLYIYSITAGSFSQVRKMMFLK